MRDGGGEKHRRTAFLLSAGAEKRPSRARLQCRRVGTCWSPESEDSKCHECLELGFSGVSLTLIFPIHSQDKAE